MSHVGHNSKVPIRIHDRYLQIILRFAKCRPPCEGREKWIMNYGILPVKTDPYSWLISIHPVFAISRNFKMPIWKESFEKSASIQLNIARKKMCGALKSMPTRSRTVVCVWGRVRVVRRLYVVIISAPYGNGPRYFSALVSSLVPWGHWSEPWLKIIKTQWNCLYEFWLLVLIFFQNFEKIDLIIFSNRSNRLNRQKSLHRLDRVFGQRINRSI